MDALHLHLHTPNITPVCPLIAEACHQLITLLLREGQHMSAAMDALVVEVAAIRTVNQSAITLLQGLAQQIRDAQGDEVKLQGIVNDLQSNEAALADAVTANTPPTP